MPQSDPVRPAEPAASGTLAKRPLAHLLIYACDRKLTGTFELLAPGDASARIHVEGGLVARVWTSEPVTYLGHVLYELGSIDDATLSLSLAQVAATKRLHGQVLLEQSLIDEPRLEEALRQQRARKLQHAFSFPAESTFAFYGEVDLVGPRPNDPPPASPLPAIWQGVRVHPSWDHVRATLARVAGRPIRLAADASLDGLGLDEHERAAADCLRLKASSVPELAIIGGLTIQMTDLLAYFLVITKQVEVVDRALVATSSSPPRAASMPPPSTAARASSPARPFSSGEYSRKISFQMRAVTEGAIVPIPSPVPERFASTAPGRVSGAPPRSITPAPGSIKPPIITSTDAPQGPASGLPPPADMARRKSILDRARWIDQEDYFKMLMIGREASSEDVRAAFLRAAKVWHPDTLPAAIADARPECEKVFRKISTAYETLVEPARRRVYERTLDNAMREGAEAAQLLQQAEMHVTLGDRAEAEELARKALVAVPGHPEASALLAFLEAMDPRKRSAEHTSAQIRVLDMAIAKDPMCRRAHYFRAELHKRLENHEEAIRDLRVAVTNDPDDTVAQRELKIYEQKLREGIVELRSHSPFPRKEKGFFDRILSKK